MSDGTTGEAKTLRIDRLEVQVYPTRQAMGEAAASATAAAMIEAIEERGAVRMAFAAAPSQNEFLAALAANPDIDWSRVTAFQLDDYVGLPAGAPQLFGTFLADHLFNQVRPGTVHLIGATSSLAGASERCRAYAELIDAEPLDIVCLGIGENGHLAFNDPPVADFDDPERAKVVELDEPCRRQQVNDGCFPTFGDVPTHAITLTIPALMSGSRLVCIVPGPAKRDAVRAALNGPIGTGCPASILRTHPACTLYLDKDSHGA
jgi:glucosamine-6-phosphate deaminase